MAWIILIIILGIAVAIALSDGKQINADNGNETGRNIADFIKTVLLIGF